MAMFMFHSLGDTLATLKESDGIILCVVAVIAVAAAIWGIVWVNK